MLTKPLLPALALLIVAPLAMATDPKPSSGSSSNSSALSHSSSHAAAHSQATAVGIGGNSIAHGGSALAAGGSATGGTSSATVGNVSNSATSAGGAGGNGGAATQSQNAAGGAGGQGGNGGNSSSNQNQSANNQGNAQSTSINTRVEDRRQAPAISAPSVFASGPCAYGWSAGVSSPVGGISGGKAKADTNCDRREVARILMGVNPGLALKVLCADPLVAAVAKPEDCVYAIPVVMEEASTPVALAPATKEEVNEAIDRAFRKSVSK